ncbi:uncharacterized protein LOC120256104 [Dioscorea cayenensis subsp. rotundata]|uniref:Uncharacterized protein LOC120256104 n=1 Tax=Dioscorea cayennensis subsp. rotundata TaxID=55577 RepID=A0AB40AXV0_DIOCR|nr:uncharacterized protein LOC120256104 [Dioscorea cayenensis subsp. rotundata]
MEENLSSKTKALVKWLETEAGMLARIEVLVVISGALMTFLALFGSYRRRSRSPTIKLTLWLALTLTDSISAYTIGLMQTAKFRNELFVLWAAFLIMVKCSTHSISAFSIQDNDNWLSNLLQITSLALYASLIYNSYFMHTRFWVPVEIFWVVCMVKFFERIFVFRLIMKPNGPMVNTKLISDYMHYEHMLSNEDEVVPALMEGYKYLIIGEKEDDIMVGPPDYLMKLRLEDPSVVYQVITVEKIWRCPGRVLNNSESAKDVCLSFAMFKLLRRRFTGYPWVEANRAKTRKLILEGLLGDHLRMFRVIETELAFLYDSFYTKYPVVSDKPWTLVSSVASLVGSCWVVVLLYDYKPPSEEEHLTRGSVDSLVTIFLLVVIIFVEGWQIITFVFSDWAKVLLLCKYVQKISWQERDLFQTLLSFVCRKRVLKPWDDKLGQYSLLDSYDYKPSLVKKLLMGVQRGQKAGAPIQLPDEVKQAITQSLIDTGGELRCIGKHSLTLCEGGDELSWACELETYTQIILVWHVATSICLIKAAPNPATDEEFNRKVTESLSKYCAYLVVFCQELLPEQNSVTEVIFARIIHETLDLLRWHTCISFKLNRLMEVGDEPETIVGKGGKLGRQLIELVGDESLRFSVLREIWLEIILYIAPSENTTAHAQHLANGGEFITHLWTLLCHLGIFERPKTGGEFIADDSE